MYEIHTKFIKRCEKEETAVKDVILREKNMEEYQDHVIYAEALAKVISTAATPLKIGLFSSWGSGKTSVLSRVQRVLRKNQLQNDAKSLKVITPRSRRLLWTTIALIVTVCLVFVTWGVLINIPGIIARSNPGTSTNPISNNSTVAPQKIALSPWQISCIVTLSVFTFVLTMMLLVICFCSSGGKPLLANLKLLMIAAFTKLPSKPVGKRRISTKNEEQVGIITDEHQVQTNYIFVNFNAWAFAGTDNLWAGMVSNISNAIEGEFGSVSARLFRITNPCSKRYDVDDTFECTNTIFAKLGSEPRLVKSILDSYGVVRSYKKWAKNCSAEHSEQTTTARDDWWVIEYSSYVEAQRAVDELAKKSIQATFDCPTENQETVLMSDETQTLLTTSKEQKSKKVTFWSLLAKYPKTACGVPILFWILLSLFVVFLPFPLVISALVVSNTFPVLAQILAWVPATAAALFAAINFVRAMFNSQATRIASALKGAKGDVGIQLGFMDKIKYEIQVINQLIRYAQISHQAAYKVVLQVDDLDKVPPQMVKDIFQAIEILLSQGTSPYVCLMAVDPSVALKSIEETINSNSGETLVDAYNYLKKFFNLSICLPLVVKCSSYVDALINISSGLQQRFGPGDTLSIDPTTLSKHGGSSNLSKKTQLFSGVSWQTAAPSVWFKDVIVVTQNNFLIECRRFLKSDKTATRFLLLHPSNIKSIFNVISFTTTLIGCIQKQLEKRRYLKRITKIKSESDSNAKSSENILDILEKLEEDASELFTLDWVQYFVYWIILTEQWPYCMSYLLHSINQSDDLALAGFAKPIPKHETIHGIYRDRVLPKILKEAESNQAELRLDADLDMLDKFLEAISSTEPLGLRIDKEKLNILSKCTVNIHYTLRHNIVKGKKNVAENSTAPDEHQNGILSS